MKQAFVTVFVTGLLGLALGLSGCSQPEASKTEPAAAASPSPSPTAAPKLTAADHLTSAKESLTKAVSELKEKNYQGAQDLLTTTQAHLTEAAASAPSTVKAGIEKARASLAGIKDIKAPGTEKTLGNLVATISSLAEAAKKAGALAGGLIGKAAEAAKDAVASGAETTKAAAEKATPKKQ
jgi:hypothetical protein